MNRNIIKLLTEIAARHEGMMTSFGHRPDERMTTMMDLESVNDQFVMDWQALLDADDSNFAHDMGGIKRHMNRDTYPGTIGDCFGPRYARGSKVAA